MTDLLRKHRPKSFAEVVGQDDVVESLRAFVADPHPTAFLFHGESGTGKTSLAYALAYELGVAVDEAELGGMHEIASGEMNAVTVRDRLNSLRLSTLFGSHWKVMICNEADRLTEGAETIWLDGLEHIPARTVIVFTTNQPERLSKRLRDRCEVFGFESEPKALQPAIKKLAKKVWEAEGMTGPIPNLDTLGMPTLGDFDTMHASFRLALRQLERLIRDGKAGRCVKKSAKQLDRDLLVTKKTIEGACDHCGHVQDIRKGALAHTCVKCGETMEVEYA